jgi:hypothetical protein
MSPPSAENNHSNEGIVIRTKWINIHRVPQNMLGPTKTYEFPLKKWFLKNT